MSRIVTALLLTAAGSTALAGTSTVNLDGLGDDTFVTSVDGVNIAVNNPAADGEQVARVWNYTSAAPAARRRSPDPLHGRQRRRHQPSPGSLRAG